MPSAQTKTPREQIVELQQTMHDDQKNVAKELVDLIAGPDVKKVLDLLQALRERTVPGSTLDTQIGGIMGQIGSLASVGAQLFQQLSQPRG